MIAFLRGTVIEKQPQRLVVDVNGVGYEVLVPLSTYFDAADAGSPAPVTLHVHTHVREDALQLFGFASRFELDLFTRLIGISGIGPKLALAVLSGIEPAELVQAVRTQNIARLTSIPGVGKKTAERIVLELREKLEEWRPERGAAEVAAARSAARTGLPAAAAMGEAELALLALGYGEEEAAEAIATVPPGSSVEETIRAALGHLSRF